MFIFSFLEINNDLFVFQQLIYLQNVCGLDYIGYSHMIPKMYICVSIILLPFIILSLKKLEYGNNFQ